jgi:uncharacterized protein (TIGR03066 family)
MSALRLLVAGLLVLGFAGGVRADDKKADIDKDKLLGAWEVVKSDEGPPVGSVVEFAKDGKLKATHKKDGKDETLEGTYKTDGDKLSVLFKMGDKEDKATVTVKKLTATEMVAENEKGKTVEFKKKK